MGLFDEDLGKLFRAVQRRRASLGEINVINIGKVPGLSTNGESEPDDEHQWQFNDDKVRDDLKLAKIVRAYRESRGTDNHDTAILPKVMSYNYRSGGSISVGGRYYDKHSLVGRIFFLTPEACQSTGYRIVRVESVARRNLACYPLWIDNHHASTRKRNFARANADQVVVRPEDVLDLSDKYETSNHDPMLDWLIECDGSPNPFTS